jgi:hypothetical protein
MPKHINSQSSDLERLRAEREERAMFMYPAQKPTREAVDAVVAAGWEIQHSLKRAGDGESVPVREIAALKKRCEDFLELVPHISTEGVPD